MLDFLSIKYYLILICVCKSTKWYFKMFRPCIMCRNMGKSSKNKKGRVQNCSHRWLIVRCIFLIPLKGLSLTLHICIFHTPVGPVFGARSSSLSHQQKVQNSETVLYVPPQLFPLGDCLNFRCWMWFNQKLL